MENPSRTSFVAVFANRLDTVPSQSSKFLFFRNRNYFDPSAILIPATTQDSSSSSLIHLSDSHASFLSFNTLINTIIHFFPTPMPGAHNIA